MRRGGWSRSGLGKVTITNAVICEGPGGCRSIEGEGGCFGRLGSNGTEVLLLVHSLKAFLDKTTHVYAARRGMLICFGHATCHTNQPTET